MTREEREDAIDIIQSILNKYEEDECLVTEITIGDGDIKAFRMAIKALEQEPRKGHWIDEGIYADGQSYHAFMCSACEWHFIENKSELENYKYCPFCGADMKEVEE